MATMTTVLVYARVTDVNGKASYQEILAWDKDLLVASRKADADRENSKQDQGMPRKAKFEQITKEQYIEGRKAKK